VRCAVILVGDELLAGHTRDANAHFLAQRLHALGHRLRRIVVVPDEAHALAAEIDHTMPQADVVFISGGLGPTHDDRTTEALAHHFGRRLVLHEPSWHKLLERYDRRGNIPEHTKLAARKMVTIPEGAEALENPVGAATGYVLREGGCALAVLPGVPAELMAIFEQGIVGRLVPQAAHVGLVEAEVEMAEASFAAALGAVAERFGDVEIGSYPHFGERRVTLRFKGDEARAEEALRTFLRECPDAKARLLGAPKTSAGRAVEV
jgi:nicotinamide-nucleotide amidase